MRHLMIGLAAVGSLVMVVAGLAGAQPKGKAYPVQVDGLSVGEVGVTRATAKGEVSHLAKLADFAGNYTAVGAGATAGGGAGTTVMRNQNGVVIELQSTTQGASLRLGTEGVRLTLVK
jgi:hypothetical protein